MKADRWTTQNCLRVICRLITLKKLAVSVYWIYPTVDLAWKETHVTNATHDKMNFFFTLAFHARIAVEFSKNYSFHNLRGNRRLAFLFSELRRYSAPRNQEERNERFP